ncbi:hypothetical protein Cgig2_017099 [Carnegiea gigantea]|uniref:Uncharacterized protein n=1 Tax=Carnegiea gigantea TaxID=171969 RepID=A0A9Q1JHX8_9CARY|nr:hypothetical protein Cgig2_017099 [Carnegiea gigantea]
MVPEVQPEGVQACCLLEVDIQAWGSYLKGSFIHFVLVATGGREIEDTVCFRVGMDRDRIWMNHRGVSDRRKPDYIVGINEFLELAFGGKEDETLVSTIHNHLIVRGILRNYNPWIHHGEYEDHIDGSDDGIEEEASNRAENFVTCDDMRPLVCKAMNVMNFGNFESIEDHTENEGGKNEVPKEFQKLMEDADFGCKTFTSELYIVTN